MAWLRQRDPHLVIGRPYRWVCEAGIGPEHEANAKYPSGYFCTAHAPDETPLRPVNEDQPPNG